MTFYLDLLGSLPVVELVTGVRLYSTGQLIAFQRTDKGTLLIPKDVQRPRFFSLTTTNNIIASTSDRGQNARILSRCALRP
jgi:hypothetical protein